MKHYYSHLALVVAIVGLAIAPASAGVVTQPGNPTTCCGIYDVGTTAFVLPQGDLTTFSSLTSGPETLTFLNVLTRLSVPTTWGSWSSPPASETSTPTVAFDSASSDTLALSIPVAVFGLELEPADFGVFNFTVNFFHNATSLGSVALAVDGNSGARLFAQEVAGNQINTVTITGDDPGGFALANIRFASTAGTAVPEPGPGFLMLLGGALIGAVRLVVPRKA